jgi:hypothetical protein
MCQERTLIATPRTHHMLIYALARAL